MKVGRSRAPDLLLAKEMRCVWSANFVCKSAIDYLWQLYFLQFANALHVTR